MKKDVKNRDFNPKTDPIYIVTSLQHPDFEHEFELYEEALDFVADTFDIYDDLYIISDEIDPSNSN